MLTPLTNSQLRVMRHIWRGLTYQQTARALVLSESTVRTHTSNVYRCLGVTDGVQALLMGLRDGWLNPQEVGADLPPGPPSRPAKIEPRLPMLPGPKAKPLTADQRRYLEAFDALLEADGDRAADQAREDLADRLGSFVPAPQRKARHRGALAALLRSAF